MPFSTLDIRLPILPDNYPISLNTTGKHILKRRLDLKLFQKDVANIIGVTESMVYYWEHNHSEPTAKHMKEVIQFLGYYPFPEPVTIGEKIRKYRYENGLTHNDFGILVGVDATTVGAWEQGTPLKRLLPKSKVEKILNRE
ncbi:MAG: hypothetical protein RJA07_905 [Bacteroidota bacterium]